MDDITNGRTRPWSYGDAELFPGEICAACGERLRLGQPVQERPAFSMWFYHADRTHCDAIDPESTPEAELQA